MAPLPINNTAVLFVDYIVSNHNHTMQLRFNDTASAGDAIAVADAFLTALDDRIFTLTILGARVRDQGGSVTYPVTWTGAASYGAGTAGDYTSGWYFDFVGRSIGGRRGRVSVFGAAFLNDTNDYRFELTDNIAYGAAMAVLEAGSGVPVAIDGDPINFNQYVNSGVNAYWRNHLR